MVGILKPAVKAIRFWVLGFGILFPLAAQERIAFGPGTIITTAVEKGDRAGNDYEFILEIKQLDAKGMTYDWSMSAPKKWKGRRVLKPQDLESAKGLNDIYTNSAIRSLSQDYTSVVWPRAAFRALKQGQSVTLKMGELEKSVNRTLKPTGPASVSVQVNGELRSLQALGCQGQDGARWVILDDEAFPLGLRSQSSWAAQVVSIRTPASGPSERSILIRTGRLDTTGIPFHTDSAELRRESEPVFLEVLAFLKEQPKARLHIEGHTDGTGGKAHNLDLSRRRAESVKARLVEGGAEAARFSIEGLGDQKPVGDNATLAGRAQNRRVVFVVR